MPARALDRVVRRGEAEAAPLANARIRDCGIGHIAEIEREMREWMEAHEYESVEQLKGSLSQRNCPDSAAFERAQYMRALAIERAIQPTS